MVSKNKKFIIFTNMATLTRYNTFKSLKQSSSSKVKAPVKTKTLAVTEVKAFFQLLNKEKVKAKKA
jgi:hypothetical protein